MYTLDHFIHLLLTFFLFSLFLKKKKNQNLMNVYKCFENSQIQRVSSEFTTWLNLIWTSTQPALWTSSVKLPVIGCKVSTECLHFSSWSTKSIYVRRLLTIPKLSSPQFLEFEMPKEVRTDEFRSLLTLLRWSSASVTVCVGASFLP